MTQRRINVPSRTRLVLATRLTALASAGRSRTVTSVLDRRVNTGPVTSSSWSVNSVRSWRSQNRASSSIEYVNDGGFMVYGSDLQFMWRRAAVYVENILKGTKPADLPFERPMKFELVVDLKAAKQIGVTITPNLLARADRVIRVRG